MKKNQKGFTLIELLAVIVILAVIALIAVPIFLSIINNAKKDTFRQNASSISKTAELQNVQTNAYLFALSPTTAVDGAVALSDIKLNKITKYSVEVDAENGTVMFFELEGGGYKIDTTKCARTVSDTDTRTYCTLEDILQPADGKDPVTSA